MRGALACMCPWHVGVLPAFPPGIVGQADLADRDDRRIERRVGAAPSASLCVSRKLVATLSVGVLLVSFDCVLLLWQYSIVWSFMGTL